jgi:Na+-transporting methylmalonyl-CoA/oxaloacetate decarboxylase gamma subunit
MSTKFKEVWIMVSNIVYFVFAFILIWIAFMNIIGKNADQYQLKQALPKFIV